MKQEQVNFMLIVVLLFSLAASVWYHHDINTRQNEVILKQKEQIEQLTYGMYLYGELLKEMTTFRQQNGVSHEKHNSDLRRLLDIPR